MIKEITNFMEKEYTWFFDDECLRYKISENEVFRHKEYLLSMQNVLDLVINN